MKNQGHKKLFIYGGEHEINPDEKQMGMNTNLYDIDDLIQVKARIEELKKQIIVPAKQEPDRDKKIYGQIVRILSQNIVYDENDENSDNITHLENRNLLALLRGSGVCQGYAEIIRNLAAEYGIQVESIRGTIPVDGKQSSHEWNQVKLDGVWYDDDFTNYRKALSTNDLNACHCFLMGKRTDGIESTKYVGYKTLQKTHSIGRTPSSVDKKFLLNYEHVKQQAYQQSIQPQEKEKTMEESIKDEVGDEFKSKNQEQQQNEQEAETKWMNSLQACDEQVARMQDGAKKKQEVVQLIQNLERERKQQQNRQIQEENENQVQGR